MTRQTFDEIAAEVLSDVTKDLMTYYQRALEAKGLVLTGELLQSFRYQIIRMAGQVVAEVEFNDYGRMRDMRRLRFVRAAPSAVMEAFVEKIGLDKFLYVPGYTAREQTERRHVVVSNRSVVAVSSRAVHRVPTVKNAVARIAAGVAFSRKGKTINRKFSGTWYNESTMNMVNIAKGRLAERLDDWFKEGMHQAAESED